MLSRNAGDLLIGERGERWRWIAFMQRDVNTRLREALEWIRDLPAISGRPITELLDEIRERARAALAGEGGARDVFDEVEAERDRLREYVVCTPCPVCNLVDPLRFAANCDQCAKARAALAGEGEG